MCLFCKSCQGLTSKVRCGMLCTGGERGEGREEGREGRWERGEGKGRGRGEREMGDGRGEGGEREREGKEGEGRGEEYICIEWCFAVKSLADQSDVSC